MAKMKIYTGSDHAGFELRGRVVAHLRALGFEVEDLGTPSAESTDYPDWAAAVGRAVRDHSRHAWASWCAAPAWASAWPPTRSTAFARPTPGASRRRVCRVRTTTPTCYAWARAWCRRRRRSPCRRLAGHGIRRWAARAPGRQDHGARRRGGGGGAATDEARGSAQMTASKQTTLHQTHALGQSIWYDNMRRSLLTSGGLAKMIAQGVRGMTSNPTIFEKAIVSSGDYEDALRKLVADGRSTIEIYEQLAIEDIRGACDLMLPLFQESGGVDGRISLEVLPELATATDKTVAEGLRLAAEVGRPNVMIKVPATPEGIPAIRALTAKGISVNVTLIFSLLQYEEVVEAYLAGLEDRDRGRRQAGRPRVGGQLLRVARRQRLRQAAQGEGRRGARAGAPLRGAARQAGDRQRQDGVRHLRAHHRGAALGEAGRGRRAAAAAALGVDRHQGSALPGHLLHRCAAGRGHRQHGAARDAGRLPRSRQAGGAHQGRPRRAPRRRWRSSRRSASTCRASATACSTTA